MTGMLKCPMSDTEYLLGTVHWVGLLSILTVSGVLTMLYINGAQHSVLSA